MTAEEIIIRFSSTPTAIKEKEIKDRIEFIKKQFQLLNAEKDKLHKKLYKLVDQINREGNQVADQLDKEFLEWRMVLVRELSITKK